MDAIDADGYATHVAREFKQAAARVSLTYTMTRAEAALSELGMGAHRAAVALNGLATALHAHGA